MEGPANMDLMESNDQITEELAGVIDLINASTNAHDSNVDPNTKSPENSKFL